MRLRSHAAAVKSEKFHAAIYADTHDGDDCVNFYDFHVNGAANRIARSGVGRTRKILSFSSIQETTNYYIQPSTAFYFNP